MTNIPTEVLQKVREALEVASSQFRIDKDLIAKSLIDDAITALEAALQEPVKAEREECDTCGLDIGHRDGCPNDAMTEIKGTAWQSGYEEGLQDALSATQPTEREKSAEEWLQIKERLDNLADWVHRQYVPGCQPEDVGFAFLNAWKAIQDTIILVDDLLSTPPEPRNGWQWVPKEPTSEMEQKGAIADGYRADGSHTPSMSPWIDNACKIYKAMLAAVPQPPDGNGWQPIESAPKDGTYILAYPCLSQIPLVVTWKRGRGWLGIWRLPMTEKAAPFTPTHWQPLPASPPCVGGGG